LAHPHSSPDYSRRSYIDRYRREADRWRFAERRAEIFFIAPRAEGWNRQRFIAVLAGRG
jgi:hypothetical protein